MTPPLIAGIASGIAGLTVFLVIHHFWIKPIWEIMPMGLVIAAVGGIAVGWSYAEIRAGLPPRPWTALALAGLIGVILAPSIIIAQFREPMLDMATFTLPPGSGGAAALRFGVDLLLTAGLVGALAGWLLGRTPQAALATAVAGLVFAIGPGHNIPFLGNTPVVGKGLALLAAITLVSAVVLVEGDAWLARK